LIKKTRRLGNFLKLANLKTQKILKIEFDLTIYLKNKKYD